MDRLEVGVFLGDFPVGHRWTAEPLINGDSLVELVGDPASRGGYAGRIPGNLVRALSAVEPGERAVAQVLGCVCGVEGCSGVTVEITATADAVRWSEFSASPFADLGWLAGFSFDPAQYAQALARPISWKPPRSRRDWR